MGLASERWEPVDLSLVTGALVARRLVHVVQGQIGVTADKDVAFTALIGSCVVVCLFDPVAKLGGMAHFLFPGGEGDRADETRFGHQAIAGLIAQITALGGDTDRLRAWVYGGAKLHDGRGDIGKRNADFAIEFLGQRSILVAARELGGGRVRRIRFSPTDGIADQLLLSLSDDPIPVDALV